eukprot:CAMPEP_0116897188 /NCGR_PEP_ID=MMETSP0467-20121206/6249_1 /TAXON_ID=283647 /ORGANISM="Mesodinium pulex, Strain SPMC105" /LENGTH=89 /DNA_ID=CAMNT_0004568743 /DNA_START=447 /DNA_END=716 /DNA_ORIENTATION=+
MGIKWSDSNQRGLPLAAGRIQSHAGAAAGLLLGRGGQLARGGAAAPDRRPGLVPVGRQPAAAARIPVADCGDPGAASRLGVDCGHYHRV